MKRGWDSDLISHGFEAKVKENMCDTTNYDYEEHDCVMSSNLKMGQAACLKQGKFLWCSQRNWPPFSILSSLFTGHPTETKLGSGLLATINCRLINYKGLKLFQALHIGLTISLLVESSSKK